MSGERATFLDSSAIVKLAVAEPESKALRRHLRRKRVMICSALARAEVARALLPYGDAGATAARDVLARLSVVRIGNPVLRAGGELQPATLRTLDAIHLATALCLQDDLAAVCTYDERMAHAARGLGMRVVAPA